MLREGPLRTNGREEMMDAAEIQKRNKGIKREGIQQDRRADSRTGGRGASSRVFHRATRSEWLDIVDESAPTETKE
jgi:hypothetical protein